MSEQVITAVGVVLVVILWVPTVAVTVAVGMDLVDWIKKRWT